MHVLVDAKNNRHFLLSVFKKSGHFLLSVLKNSASIESQSLVDDTM
jgi:hypothetical protein